MPEEEEGEKAGEDGETETPDGEGETEEAEPETTEEKDTEASPLAEVAEEAEAPAEGDAPENAGGEDAEKDAEGGEVDQSDNKARKSPLRTGATPTNVTDATAPDAGPREPSEDLDAEVSRDGVLKWKRKIN